MDSAKQFPVTLPKWAILIINVIVPKAITNKIDVKLI